MFIIESYCLFAGMDIGNEYSQVSYYDEALFEPVSLREDEEECEMIPTVLALRQEDHQWFAGKKAIRQSSQEDSLLLEHFIDKILRGEPLDYYDKVWDKEQILSKYLRGLLMMIQKEHPSKKITMLTVTIEEWNKELKEGVEEALKELGFEKDRMQIISRKQCYMYYALSQKKELWKNNVGLFHFDRKEFGFYHLCLNERTNPFTAGVERQDYTDLLSFSMVNHEEEEKKLQHIFDYITKKALHKKVVSAIYVTGEGFQGNWALKILEGLCVGRRVFLGQNLYSSGACYASIEAVRPGKLSEYVYLSEEMILVNISVKLYHNTKMEKYYLCKAGSMWDENYSSIEVIPDGENELEIEIYNVIEQNATIHYLHIDELESRPPKTTILEIMLRFLNPSACVLQVKDKGFGDLYPSTNRIWEKEIHF